MAGFNKPWHWIVLAVVLLLVFGSKKLPDMARSIGQSMKIFKKEIKELSEDDTTVSNSSTNPAEAKHEDKA